MSFSCLAFSTPGLSPQFPDSAVELRPMSLTGRLATSLSYRHEMITAMFFHTSLATTLRNASVIRTSTFLFERLPTLFPIRR
jgi:hypothetical protein